MAQANESSGRPELLVALAAFLVLIGAVVALLRTDLQTAMIPVGFALAASVVLVVLWLRLRRVRGVAETQQLAVDTQRRESERNQQAILRLLDELSSLADGDLTVQATVTEDITGAIADSINYAVDALRGLVTTINSSAISLDGAARQT
jgi:twitching motility protein PilJ